jgi:hypothetical protein
MRPRARSSLSRDRRPRGDHARLTLALAGSLLGPGIGQAQPVASSSSIDPSAVDPQPPPRGEPIELAPRPVPEPTAADVDGAPVPGQESGRVDRRAGGDSPPRLIGRGILFLPKVAFQVVFAPIRGGIWANERYRIYDRAYELLFNDAGTMGVYPTARLDSSFGVTVGARFVHRDLLGAREHLSLAAGAGGRYRGFVSGSLRSGDRLGERLELELEAEYDRRPKEHFYGIGNRDEVEVDEGMPVPVLLDALAGDTSVEARYRQRLARATAVVDVRLAGALHLLGSGALTDLEVARSDEGVPIDVLYRPDTLIGWGGARHVYTELELRWDSRRRASPWEVVSLPATGWFAGVYGGPVIRIDDEGVDFWRYGADVQRFLRVGRGPRVISARAHVEAVTGSRDEVPFFDLPQLGGKTLLRGYEIEQFRDRIAVLGSLDYQWDLSQIFSARVFADVGRVYASADDLELADLRVGYGVGLDAHGRTSFWVRSSIASSIDGGIFVTVSFEPVFDVGRRVEKR